MPGAILDRVSRTGFFVLSAAVAALWLAAGSNAAGSGGAPSVASLKTPAQILAAAVQAVDGATSVHIVAAGTSGGRPLRFDLKLVAARGGEGTVTENGLTFQMVRIGTKAYFEAGATFWKKFAGSVGPQLFDGKWIEASATSGQLASLTPLTSLRTFITGVLKSHGTLAVGKSATVGGRSAIALNDTTEGGTLYIAASGTPYPLEITSSGRAGGTVKFESWNQRFSLAPPKNPLNFTNQLTK
jgi:hypothetical protein